MVYTLTLLVHCQAMCTGTKGLFARILDLSTPNCAAVVDPVVPWKETHAPGYAMPRPEATTP